MLEREKGENSHELLAHRGFYKIGSLGEMFESSPFSKGGYRGILRKMFHVLFIKSPLTPL
jgi:hypothetical protein